MNTQDSAEANEPYWKRRYMIVLHGFAIYFLINSHRINMSVAIVSMVEDADHGNHTEKQLSNTSIEVIDGISHDQGLMFPAATVLAANWYPRAERGLLSGLALSGYGFGVLVSGILSSLICDSVSIGGWPCVFYIFGGFGIFISILQMLSLKNFPKDDPRISREELKFILKNQENKLELKRPAVPWRKILISMPTYALFIGTFGQTWIGAHFLLVHATFLGTILHYSMAQTGILISVPYVISMFSNVSSGFISSFLSTKEYLSISKIRKSWNIIGNVIYSLCLALLIFTNSEDTAAIVCSIIAIGILGLMNSGVMIVALDMTPTFAGSLNALNITVGSLPGVILPIVCGIITNDEQTIEQWNKFFILSIIIVMSSAMFFSIFGTAEIQSYNFSPAELSLKAERETKTSS
ncbi:sodium-dependent phosphate transport protein 1-like isoform X2 [Uloborus diversus]|uniref:sodium-dependent phosphate transport protein 1-like isoform X2 n=1 Tax=Uloborus diversus TaxID=327109 RepID=UPI002409099F|nr:sodium-dependent phosphate transport protein 1-like isoform X2 [Uloborus diversus]